MYSCNLCECRGRMRGVDQIWHIHLFQVISLVIRIFINALQLFMLLNPDFQYLAHSFVAIKQTKIVLHTPNFAYVNFSICLNIC